MVGHGGRAAHGTFSWRRRRRRGQERRPSKPSVRTWPPSHEAQAARRPAERAKRSPGSRSRPLPAADRPRARAPSRRHPRPGADRGRDLPRRVSRTCTGPAGRSATARSRATQFVFGALGYAVPAAPGRGRRADPDPRAAPAGSRRMRDRAGCCLVAALTLALAAGTLGLGPGAAPRVAVLAAPPASSAAAASSARPSSGSPRTCSRPSAPTSWPCSCSGRADPGQRRDARRRAAGDRRRGRRHRARAAALDRGAGARRSRGGPPRPPAAPRRCAARTSTSRRARCCRPSPTPPSWSSAPPTSRRRRSSRRGRRPGATAPARPAPIDGTRSPPEPGRATRTARGRGATEPQPGAVGAAED